MRYVLAILCFILFIITSFTVSKADNLNVYISNIYLLLTWLFLFKKEN